MWTRPATLEELIPPEVRARWGILTSTRIIWTKPTLEESEREIADGNTIEIAYAKKGKGSLDSRLREYMKANKIPTVHSESGNLAKLRMWAVSQGKKIRLVQEKA
jgi:hypothetical protein